MVSKAPRALSQVWELVGLGAERNHGRLAFGPIVRYIPLSPKLIGKRLGIETSTEIGLAKLKSSKIHLKPAASMLFSCYLHLKLPVFLAETTCQGHCG